MASVFTRFFRRSQNRHARQSEATVPDGVRVYAIGDVHGRLDLLQQLHALIAADLRQNPIPRSVEIYLGDYIDRGADSRGVLETLSSGPAICDERICLKGNHEKSLQRFLDGEDILSRWKKYGGLDTLISYGVKPVLPVTPDDHAGLRDALAAEFPDTHRKFLENLPLCTTMGGYFFVHAGVRPGVDLGSQIEDDLLWIREPFLDSNTVFEKMIVHGHTPVEEPGFHPNRINIDTGAYVSGKLTCLVLEAATRKLLSTKP